MILEAGQRRRRRRGLGDPQQGVESGRGRKTSFFNSRRKQLIARGCAPVHCDLKRPAENVDEGGLISYGASHRQALASMSAAFSRVRQPADLPVLQPTKFEMVINLKTAKALGLELPAAPHCAPTR